MKKIIVKQQDVDKLTKLIILIGNVIADYKKALGDKKKVSLLGWIGILVKNAKSIFHVAKSLPEISNEIFDFESNEYPEIENALVNELNFNPENPYVKQTIAEGVKGLACLKNCTINSMNLKVWEENIK